MIAAYFPGMTADGYSSLRIQINIEFSGHDECSLKRMVIVKIKCIYTVYTVNTVNTYIHNITNHNIT